MVCNLPARQDRVGERLSETLPSRVAIGNKLDNLVQTT